MKSPMPMNTLDGEAMPRIFRTGPGMAFTRAFSLSWTQCQALTMPSRRPPTMSLPTLSSRSFALLNTEPIFPGRSLIQPHTFCRNSQTAFAAPATARPTASTIPRKVSDFL